MSSVLSIAQEYGLGQTIGDATTNELSSIVLGYFGGRMIASAALGAKAGPAGAVVAGGIGALIGFYDISTAMNYLDELAQSCLDALNRCLSKG